METVRPLPRPVYRWSARLPAGGWSLPEGCVRRADGYSHYQCTNPRGRLAFRPLEPDSGGASLEDGPPQPGEVRHEYTAGWHLVAGLTGQQLSGPLWTLRDGEYVSVPPDQAQVDGGYWVFVRAETLFRTPHDVAASLAPVTVAVPAGWSLVGNARPFGVTVSGADVVLGYDPIASRYVKTDVLGVDQAALVYLATGGTVTLSPLRRMR